MKQISTCFLVLLLQFAVAQNPQQELEQVDILLPNTFGQKGVNPGLQRKQIALLNADDLGQVLQRFAGVNLKNYGGLGGLKTISVRGIGGQHTAILCDGFLLSSAQTGMLDLSQLTVENVEEISLGTALQGDKMLPVSAYLAGNVLEITSFENRFTSDTFSMRATMRTGSFGQLDGNLSLKIIPDKKREWLLALFAKARSAEGSYPFELQNGNETYRENRTNNELNEQYAGFTLAKKGVRPAFEKFVLQYQGVWAKRGLPGAVILYNPMAFQSLKTETERINLSLNQKFKSIDLFHYFTYSYNFLKYVDSAYLNKQGYLDENYFFNTGIHGLTAKKRTALGKLTFIGGAEQQYSELKGSNYLKQCPNRYQFKGLLGAEYHFNRFMLLAQLGYEWAQDNRNNLYYENQTLTSFVQFRSQEEICFWGYPIFWFKRSFRLPSFSELFFNEFSNKNILPETANQINFGTRKVLHRKKMALQIRLDVYGNLVQNKIVVIPTQNLFVWSVQNFGLVQMAGLDAELQVSRVLGSKWLFDARGTYSFQHAVDVTDKDAANYGEQIPYIPVHSSNLDLTINSKKWGFSCLNSYVSQRYALAQNIAANSVDGFYLLDLSVQYRFAFRQKQKCSLSLSVKNVTNNNYAFVRYYVMPGRNYLITLNYAL